MITTVSFDLDDTLWNPRPALIAADKAQWQALAKMYPEFTEHFSQDRIFRCRKKVLEDAPSIIGDVTALRLEVMIQLLTSLGIDAEQAASTAAAAFAAAFAVALAFEREDSARVIAASAAGSCNSVGVLDSAIAFSSAFSAAWAAFRLAAACSSKCFFVFALVT